MEWTIKVWNWVRTNVREWPIPAALLFYILISLVVGFVVIGKSGWVQQAAAVVLGIIGGGIIGIGLGFALKPDNPYSNITLGAAGSLGLDGVLEQQVGGLKAMIVDLKRATLDHIPLIPPDLVDIWLAYVMVSGIPLALAISITRWHKLHRSPANIGGGPV